MKKNRWYDKNIKLASNLEKFKNMGAETRKMLLKDVINIVKKESPTLYEKHMMEYPLDILQRRWYDSDPYLWLVVNGLKYADNSTIEKVIAYLEDVGNES